MIHVHKDFDAVPKSLQLMEEEYALLKEGKELDKSYYEQDVLDALTEVYGGKCAYCEQKVEGRNGKGVKPQNIFHYRPVKLYPWLKYEWSNLLLVCDDCLRMGRFYSSIFPTMEYTVAIPSLDTKEWRVDSNLFLGEKPLLLNPEIEKAELFFDLDITGTVSPKLGNLKTLFTIHFAGLNRNNIRKHRKYILHTYIKNDNDFFHNQTKENAIEELESDSSFLFTKNYLPKKENELKNDYESFRYSNNKKSTIGNWLTSITITQLRHLYSLPIPINEIEKKHLILTGKNGSGKTTVLRELNDYLSAILNYKEQPSVQHFETIEGNLKQVIGETKIGSLDFLPFIFGEGTSNNEIFEWSYSMFIGLNRYGENIIEQYRNNEFIYLYFPAIRYLELNKVDVNSKINTEKNANNGSTNNLSQDLQNFLVRLNIRRIAAIANNKIEEQKGIEDWLKDFTIKLREIIEDESLTIDFPIKGLDFNIKLKSERFGDFLSFEYLPLGYSAFLKIVIDIILTVVNSKESGWESINYNIEGIVLIDEVSSHLHVDLQKQVLPILTSFFPNIQFIVTTHSPFVLNSIDGAIVYDLENHHTFESNTKYSTSGIIETHFQSDEYSEEVKEKLKKYRELVGKEKLSDREEHEKNTLKYYFEDVMSFMSPELKFILQDIQLKEVEKKYMEKMKNNNG